MSSGAAPVLSVGVDGVEPRTGPVFEPHVGLQFVHRGTDAGDEVADHLRAVLPPRLVVFSGNAVALLVVGEYVLGETLDCVAEEAFELPAGELREVGRGAGVAAVVERIAVEAVLGENLADEAQRPLLVLGHGGVEERHVDRLVVADVEQRAVGHVFDAGAAVECRVAEDRALPRGCEPCGKIVVETVTSRSRRAASSRKNCR